MKPTHATIKLFANRMNVKFPEDSTVEEQWAILKAHTKCKVCGEHMTPQHRPGHKIAGLPGAGCMSAI
jgi:hypothetical protein